MVKNTPYTMLKTSTNILQNEKNIYNDGEEEDVCVSIMQSTHNLLLPVKYIRNRTVSTIN